MHSEEDLGLTMAARLRELRQSWGYDTAAEFARAIGYKPSTYQRFERRFPDDLRILASLSNAIQTVGPMCLDWVFFRLPPPWLEAVAARTALQIRNGVPKGETERLFKQDMVCCRLAYEKRYGRYVWPYEREDAGQSQPLIDELIEEGMVERTSDGVRLTPAGLAEAEEDEAMRLKKQRTVD